MLRGLHRVSVGCYLTVVGTLSGCSGFSHTAIPEDIRTHRVIDVAISASEKINPNAAGQAQPVKVCVIEANKAGWMPDGLRDGTPCRDSLLSDGALGLTTSILQPNETLRYRFTIPADQERWMVIGAEFQQVNGGVPLIEQFSPVLVDSKIRVMAENTSLSVMVNDNMDE